MSQNFFTGAIPQGITELKKLQYLDVSGNRLSGLIPSDITGMRRLTYMSLSNNGFAGRIPNLTGLWQLNTLDLSANQFYGDLPNLPVSLRNEYFQHNIFSGNLTPLKGLIHIKWLDLSDKRLSGAIRGNVLSLRGVVHLNISLNRFTTLEVINYSLQGHRLQVLEAQGNHLKGRLPPNLVSFVNLTTINLANNQLSGPIPLEYGTKEIFRQSLLTRRTLKVALQITVSSAQRMLFSATGDKDRLQNVSGTTYYIGPIYSLVAL
ncbi:putative inactive leucine-rich repeat receptor kinase XIAO, partial [Mucuna pruriens]